MLREWSGKETTMSNNIEMIPTVDIRSNIAASIIKTAPTGLEDARSGRAEMDSPHYP